MPTRAQLDVFFARALRGASVRVRWVRALFSSVAEVSRKVCIMKILSSCLFVSIATLVSASTLPKKQLYYVDWISAVGGGAGSATGIITLPDATAINVTYSGEVYFAQVDGGGENYWAASSPPPYNNSEYNAYTGVPNMPNSSDIIVLRGSSSLQRNTLSFSPPVRDAVLLILSLGSSSIFVNYDFDQWFTILSSGTGWSGGDKSGSLSNPAEDVLQGREGHGAIRLNDQISSISWSASPRETWHGFTVGLPGPASLHLLEVITKGGGDISIDPPSEAYLA